MDFLWTFLYTALDVFPFLPLLSLALGTKLSKGRIWAVNLSTVGLVLLQGTLFAHLYPHYEASPQWQLSFRELSAMLYLLPPILITRQMPRKVLFVFCNMVPASLFAVSASYLPIYIDGGKNVISTPCAEEILARVIIILVMYLPLLLYVKRILRPAIQIASGKVWSQIWLIPLFLSALSLLFTHHYFHTEYLILFVILRLFVMLGTLVCSSILLLSLSDMKEYVAAKAESEQSKRLLAIQEEQYRIVSRNIAQTRALKHDLRHQLFMIRTLTQDEKYDQLREFVDRCTSAPALSAELSVCDNYIVNSIVTHYIAMARENHIDISATVSKLGEALTVEDTDLCILIGNATENAIEATSKLPEEARQIRFRMKNLAGNLMMTVDNTYAGEIRREGEKFLSAKREGEQEGIGLRSIRSIVDKYGGDMRIETKDGWFYLSVMLLLPPEAK